MEMEGEVQGTYDSLVEMFSNLDEEVVMAIFEETSRPILF